MLTGHAMSAVRNSDRVEKTFTQAIKLVRSVDIVRKIVQNRSPNTTP